MHCCPGQVTYITYHQKFPCSQKTKDTHICVSLSSIWLSCCFSSSPVAHQLCPAAAELITSPAFPLLRTNYSSLILPLSELLQYQQPHPLCMNILSLTFLPGCCVSTVTGSVAMEGLRVLLYHILCRTQQGFGGRRLALTPGWQRWRVWALCCSFESSPWWQDQEVLCRISCSWSSTASVGSDSEPSGCCKRNSFTSRLKLSAERS